MLQGIPQLSTLIVISAAFHKNSLEDIYLTLLIMRRFLNVKSHLFLMGTNASEYSLQEIKLDAMT